MRPINEPPSDPLTRQLIALAGDLPPRDRADYAEIKRKLLCGPIFSAQAHRNLARAFAAAVGNSEETVEEVLDEIFAEKDDIKPQ